MKRKKNIKDINISFFIIPFILLFILFSSLVYISVNMRFKNIYSTYEHHSSCITKSYAKRVIDSHIAKEIIAGLLDEKLQVICKTIRVSEVKESRQDLINFADDFYVDEINLYNKSGEIINTTTDELKDWKAPQGHPINNFIISGQEYMIEDIRANEETGIFYKYSYIKDNDDVFYQIGILAENVNEFLQRFEIKLLLNDIITNEDVKYAFFTNANNEIIDSNTKETIGKTFDQNFINKYIQNDETSIFLTIFSKRKVLYTSTPIYYKDKGMGNLIVIWPIEIMTKEIKSNFLTNLAIFTFIAFILIGVLYYAYCKNKSNIRIAYYDKITGLPNTEYLKEYLNKRSKKGKEESLIIIMVTCTNLEIINMTYSFEYGNNILQQMANAFHKVTSYREMWFRFTTDKFILVIDDYRDINDLKKLCQQLNDEFDNPIYDMHKYKYLNFKAVIYELQEEITVEKILHDTSLGLGILKKRQNEDVIFYNEEIKDNQKREEIIEKELISFIEGEKSNSFYMVFQPKLHMKTNKVIGFEALSRMNIKGLGVISPLEFINLAERRNLIFPLGNIILKEACDFLNFLKRAGDTKMSVSVNISKAQLLREGFIDTLKTILASSEIQYKQLEFEITESVFADNFDLINSKLAEIKNLGIKISLDDFGTGYSSFAGLRDLNIDIIKIDRYFVEKIGILPEKKLIIEDIIAMAHKLGLTVVAEGIENKKQSDYLKTYDCDIAQGFYFSKPLIKFKVLEFLGDSNINNK